MTISHKKRWLTIAVVSLALVWAYLSWQRNQAWANNLQLFSTDIPHLENAARAHYHYANALILEHQNQPDPSKLDEIVHHLERAIEIADFSYNARHELGRFLVNNNQADRASPVLEEFVNRFPDQGRPYYFLGYCRYFQGQYEEAVQNFLTSIEMAPNREDVYLYLAWSYYQMDSIPLAIDVLEQRLQVAPNTIGFYDALSDFYFMSSDPAQGHALLDTAIQIDPGNLPLQLKRVQRYEQGGDLARANYYREQMK